MPELKAAMEAVVCIVDQSVIRISAMQVIVGLAAN
jgi:hypothetical protein